MSTSSRTLLKNRNKHRALGTKCTEEDATAHGDNANAASPIVESLEIHLDDNSSSSVMFSTVSRGPKITDEAKGNHDYAGSINFKRRPHSILHRTNMTKSALSRGAGFNNALIANAIPRIEFGPRETASFKTLLRPEPISYRRLAMLAPSDVGDCGEGRRTNIENDVRKQKLPQKLLSTPRASSRLEQFYPSSYDSINLQLSILEPITSTLWGLLIGVTFFFPRFVIRIIMRKESHDSSSTILSNGGSGKVEPTKSSRMVPSENWGYFADFREEKEEAMFLSVTSLRWPRPRARGAFTLEKVMQYEYEFEE